MIDTRWWLSNEVSYVRAGTDICVQFSSRWYICARKIPYALDPVSQKFPPTLTLKWFQYSVDWRWRCVSIYSCVPLFFSFFFLFPCLQFVCKSIIMYNYVGLHDHFNHQQSLLAQCPDWEQQVPVPSDAKSWSTYVQVTTHGTELGMDLYNYTCVYRSMELCHFQNDPHANRNGGGNHPWQCYFGLFLIRIQTIAWYFFWSIFATFAVNDKKL